MALTRREMVTSIAITGGILAAVIWAPLHFLAGVHEIPVVGYYIPSPLDFVAVGVVLGAVAGLALSMVPDEADVKEERPLTYGDLAPQVFEEKKFGVLFNIDRLGPAYGAAAYRILFDALADVDMTGFRFWDGDTNATLFGSAREYCIAVHTVDAARFTLAWNAVSEYSAEGILPGLSRFISANDVEREPLVPAGRIDDNGDLADCTTGWMIQALEESRSSRS